MSVDQPMLLTSLTKNKLDDTNEPSPGFVSDYKSPAKKVETPLKNAIRKGLTDRTNTSIYPPESIQSKNKKTVDEESPVTRRRPPVRLLSFSCFESDIVWTPPKAKVNYERSTSAERVSTKKIVRKRITESVLSDNCIEKKRSCAIRNEFFQSNVSLVEDDVFEPDDTSPNVSCASEHSSASCSLSRSFVRTQSTGQLECQQKSPLLSPEVDYSLPGVEHPQRESLAFRSISAGTLASEIRRLGPEGFERRYTLVDCRYPYEYEGGHVM
ncbi:hypothetical protein ANCDUO_12685, partial [Ancylostoma duodenale]